MNVKQAIEQLYAIPAENIKGNDTLAIVIVKEEIEKLQAKLDAIERWATASVQFDDFGYQMARDSVLQILRGDE